MNTQKALIIALLSSPLLAQESPPAEILSPDEVQVLQNYFLRDKAAINQALGGEDQDLAQKWAPQINKLQEILKKLPENSEVGHYARFVVEGESPDEGALKEAQAKRIFESYKVGDTFRLNEVLGLSRFFHEEPHPLVYRIRTKHARSLSNIPGISYASALLPYTKFKVRALQTHPSYHSLKFDYQYIVYVEEVDESPQKTPARTR